MLLLPGGRKKNVKIGLTILIQYRRVLSSQAASQPRCRSIIPRLLRRAGKNVNFAICVELHTTTATIVN